MVPFWLKFLVKVVALPPTGPLLVALAGLAISLRHPRRGRWIAFLGVASLVLFAIPAVATYLVRALAVTPALDLSRVQDAQAIVILGGGTRRHAPEYGGATLGTLTLERVRYGAKVARTTGLPVLVSGGPIEHRPIEALLMRDVLTREFNVPVRWMEPMSTNTHENARFSAAILKSNGVHTIVLVAHSFDIPRARAEFEATGLSVIAAPTGIPPATPTEAGDFLPSPAALQESYYALYELLANALYWMQH